MRERQTRLSGVYFLFNATLIFEVVGLFAGFPQQTGGVKRWKVSRSFIGPVPEIAVEKDLSGDDQPWEKLLHAPGLRFISRNCGWIPRFLDHVGPIRERTAERGFAQKVAI